MRVDTSPNPDTDMPQYGGTVGFADGRIGFCVACGWRGVPTYTGGWAKRLLRWTWRRGELVPLHKWRWSYKGAVVHALQGRALTICPACGDKTVDASRRAIHAGKKKRGKAKAAKAARRRNR